MWNKKKEGKVFIISGPSGSGKTTLKQKILSHKDISFTYSVSFTTRNPLQGEENGKDYFFVSKSEFQKKIENGDFLEYADVYGSYYGTDALEVHKILEKGQNVLIDVDTQGAHSLRKCHLLKEAVYIFILPPSLQELEKRLTERKRDDRKEIEKRLSVAKKEIAEAHKYHYCIENRTIETMVKDIQAIIQAELLKSDQYTFD